MYNISKRENEIIHQMTMRDMIIFSSRDIQRFLNITQHNTNRLVQSMKNKDLIRSVEKGKYILTSNYNELDIYEITPHIYIPSYVAFWTALHVHRMTDQVPRTVFMAITRRKRSLELQGQTIRYVTLEPSLFFGYEKIDNIIVSDREKTIIDCLRMPSLSGGIDHVFSAMDDELDTELLVDYCCRTMSTTISSRLGYLLEKKNLEFNRKELLSMITTYSKLEPSGKKIDPDKNWKIYVNRELTC